MAGFDNRYNGVDEEHYHIIDVDLRDGVPRDDRGRENYFMSISKLEIQPYHLQNISNTFTPMTIAKEQRHYSIFDEIHRPRPSVYEQTSPTEIETPIMLYSATTRQSYFYHFPFPLYEEGMVGSISLSSYVNSNGDIKKASIFGGQFSVKVVKDLCIDHNLPPKACRVLFDQFLNLQRVVRYEKLYSENHDLADHREKTKRIIPNAHLSRSSTAIDAELESLHKDIEGNRIKEMYLRENLTYDVLQKRIEVCVNYAKEQLTLLLDAHNKEREPNKSRIPIASIIQDQVGSSTTSENTAKAVPPRKMSRKERRQRIKQFAYNRFVIIHSCLLPPTPDDKEAKDTKGRILISLLDEVYRYNLDKELFTIIVIHFGDKLPAHLEDDYPMVIFIHMSEDISFFEVPTIRILHRLSQWLVAKYDEYGIPQMMYRLLGGPSVANPIDVPLNLYPQALYMHTKGVSYATIYPMIEEWRHYMTHFLIEKHKTAFHLLQSGEYDVYGVNYGPEPRMLSGNFWWATTSYMARELEPLLYEKAMKYSAELWLFESRGVNVYHPFISDFDHAVARFPRYCYAEVNDFYRREGHRFAKDPDQFQYMLEVSKLPPYEIWRIHCKMVFEVEYRKLHGINQLITDEELKTKELLDSMTCHGGRKSSRSERESFQ